MNDIDICAPFRDKYVDFVVQVWVCLLYRYGYACCTGMLVVYVSLFRRDTAAPNNVQCAGMYLFVVQVWVC